MFKNRLRTAGAIAAAVAATLSATATSAAAAPKPISEPAMTIAVDSTWCVDGAFCVFENSGYTGSAFRSGYDTPNVGSLMNDKMTSLWNRTNKYVCLYRSSWYNDRMIPVGQGAIFPGQSIPNVNPDANDQLTSFRFSTSYNC
jgi:hypothetical protein